MLNSLDSTLNLAATMGHTGRHQNGEEGRRGGYGSIEEEEEKDEDDKEEEYGTLWVPSLCGEGSRTVAANKG